MKSKLFVSASGFFLLLIAVLSSCSSGGGGGTPAVTTYTVGGTVSGLAGSGLVLQNNGGDNLAITSSGAFTFATALADGATFSVTVQTQPSAQTCTVASGTGAIAGANISNVTVTCSTSTFTVGGTLGGLSGTVVLQNNGANDLSLTTNGSFTFTTPVADGSPYAVTVKTQPAAQACFVTNGAGTISGANVSNVAVACANSGSPDTTFGSTGIVVHNSAAGGIGTDVGNAIVIDASGKILVTGSSINALGNSDMVIWRYNADGTPDTTFNIDGKVVHNSAAGGGGNDSGNAIALDAIGRILVAGQSVNILGNSDMVVWRYNADGTPDTTFNADGKAFHNGAAGVIDSGDVGTAIVLDSVGRILVAGISQGIAASDELVIWRFKPDGTLDGTFDGDGIVVNGDAAGGNNVDTGNAIALDSSGRILVTGSSINLAQDSDMVIWRFLNNGALDVTFGASGIVVHDNAAGGLGDVGNAIALDSIGRILVAGLSANAAGNLDLVIWRYKPDGTLDTTFGTNGIVVHSNAAGGSGADEGNAIALDSNGRILVTGSSDHDNTAISNPDMVIWRFNADGTPDTNFNVDGKVVHSNAAGGDGADGGNAIALDSNGRITVTGSSLNAAGNSDTVIWRYNP